MNRILFIVGLTASLLSNSCTKTRPADEKANAQRVPTVPKTDDLVRTTLTNNEGVKLEMTFNNANQTATFILNGEVIELKQDTVASGIKYSSADYEYQEHQGEKTLTKDGKAVFTDKN